MPESPGVVAQDERRELDRDTYQPPEDWKKMVEFHRQRLELAKQARNTPDHNFDNLTFIQDFYSNLDAANSYLRPKRNDDEVRVVGGTTEKRLESIVNELESMNYQHEIHAYDQTDAMIEGLGRAMEDCVTRTNQLEEDEDLVNDIIWELCSQRAVFIEEILETKRVGEAKLRQCRRRVRSSLEVIVGDPTMPYYLFQEQPFIAVYDRMSLSTAKQFFGHYKNFKYVRGGQDLSTDVYGSDITFRLGILQQDEVEVVKYMSVTDNEYQIYINGVPMLEPGTKLPFQYPFPRYPLSVAIPKRMGHHVFWGRPITAALKYLQALNDETVRNIIRKFRQAIEPPRAVMSSERIYPRDIYDPGRISYGVNADALKPLTSHVGITDAETTVLSMIRQMQDELSARGDLQLGSSAGKKQSATAVVEQQKQAVKMLGQLVLAYSSLVRQMTKNRIYNIIESFEKPDEVFDVATGKFVKQFRRFTLKDQPLDNGKSGDSVVQFIDSDLTQEQHEAIDDMEEQFAEEGKPVRLTAVNIKKLKKMSINWWVTVVSKPKDNDDLHKLMFKDKMDQAATISKLTGRPLNGERIVDEYENTWKAKDWFKEQQEQPEQQPGQEQPAEGENPQGSEDDIAGSGMINAFTSGIQAQTRKPTQPSAKPKQLMGAM